MTVTASARALTANSTAAAATVGDALRAVGFGEQGLGLLERPGIDRGIRQGHRARTCALGGDLQPQSSANPSGLVYLTDAATACLATDEAPAIGPAPCFHHDLDRARSSTFEYPCPFEPVKIRGRLSILPGCYALTEAIVQQSPPKPARGNHPFMFADILSLYSRTSPGRNWGRQTSKGIPCTDI